MRKNFNQSKLKFSNFQEYVFRENFTAECAKSSIFEESYDSERNQIKLSNKSLF